MGNVIQLFTEQEKKIITTTVDLVFGPGQKSHLMNGVIKDRIDKISLRDLHNAIEELAAHCTSYLLKVNEGDPLHDAFSLYNSMHFQILQKIDTALDDPNLADLDFFDHPFWDML